jgi:acetyltransferase-like isoleucine patch superfamily enzyme
MKFYRWAEWSQIIFYSENGKTNSLNHFISPGEFQTQSGVNIGIGHRFYIADKVYIKSEPHLIEQMDVAPEWMLFA